MLKVIVVDDEVSIREELKSYLENNTESFEISGIFSNGEEAIRFLKDNPDAVDVVLTDIQMTTVSGVLLVQMIDECELDTIIISMSGIKEYECLKLAIKYNSFAFVEKPIDYNELNDVFDRIKKHLIIKRNVVNDATADKQNLLTLQFLIEVYAGFFNGYEQLLAWAKRFGFKECFIKRPCFKFTVEIVNEESEWKYGEEGREFAIQNAFRTKGIEIYNIFSTSNSMDLLAIPDNIMHPYKSNNFKEKMYNVLLDAAGLLKEMGIKLDIRDVMHFDYLYDLMLNHRDFMQELKIKKFIYALSMELLSSNFSKENKQKIEQILADFELKNYKIDLNAFYGGADNKHSPVSFKEKHDTDNSAIKKSLEWIHTNYNWNITLADAAAEVMLSPVYFGRLFKMHVGVSFTAYLLDFRLNKARHLLKDSMLNVREIANLIGYKDVNYFIRLFKKKYGVSPNEFKKQW